MVLPRTAVGGRALSWALAFFIWSLGLARYLGEAFYLLPLFSSPLAVGGMAAVGGTAGWFLGRWVRTSPRLHRAGGWAGLLLPLAYLLTPQPDPLMGLVLLVGGVVLTPLIAGRPDKRSGVLLLTLTVFSIYLRTMGRTVGEADTFEFQVVAPSLGIAHPTGYPLYILLGKLFSLIPLGSMAWRVNLTSAVFTTGAVVLSCLSLERLTQEPLAPLLTACALAFSRVLWSQAVVAEVYGLNLLFVAAVLALTAELLEGRAERRTVRGLAFLLGLSLTNHLTTVLLLPAVGLALLLARPRLGWREWPVGAALFLLGLSVYTYIPLRWPALHDGRWMGAGEFLAYVTGQQFSGALQLSLLRDPTRYAILGRLLLEPFGWAGLILAAVGLGWTAARRPRLALTGGLAFLAYALYGLAYRVPDIAVFLLPAHLILALWMGAGLALLTRLTDRLRPLATGLLLALFALLPLSRIWLNLPAVDQSGRVEAERWGRYVLSLPLASSAAILADGEKFAPLYYLQQIEGMRPDLDLVVHFTEEEYRADLAARLAAGQTVYLARYLPHLDGFYLRSLGPLVEVGTEPLMEPPPGARPARATFGQEVELTALELEADPRNRPLWHLTLYWQAEDTPQEDLEVRLRLVDRAGEVAWTSDGSRPVGGNYPTNGWLPGAIVADYHPVPLPPWLAPGRYDLEVGLFPRFSGSGLPVDNGPGSWWRAAQVTVDRVEAGDALPYRVRMLLGPAWLVGFDLPTSAPAGSPVAVDLAWARGVGAGVAHLEWVDEAGQAVGGQEVEVAAGAGRSRARLAAPDVPGTYRLRVGWTGGTAHCHWLAPPTDGCMLASVKVTPAQVGLANFDGRILLAAAEVGADRLRPGASLPVLLRWRALRAMEEDYTVTVQLLGPDGRLHGQVDAWPVQGTLPTSRWVPGQEVTDPYQVTLSPDSPAGRYQVVVGVYLLATMERLPVVDPAGNPVGDHVVIGELEVGP